MKINNDENLNLRPYTFFTLGTTSGPFAPHSRTCRPHLIVGLRFVLRSSSNAANVSHDSGPADEVTWKKACSGRGRSCNCLLYTSDAADEP